MEGLTFIVGMGLLGIYMVAGKMLKQVEATQESIKTLSETVKMLNGRDEYSKTSKNVLYPVFSEREINEQSDMADHMRREWVEKARELGKQADGSVHGWGDAELKTAKIYAASYFRELERLEKMILVNHAVIRGEKTIENARVEAERHTTITSGHERAEAFYKPR
jgi:hypothetical protein